MFSSTISWIPTAAAAVVRPRTLPTARSTAVDARSGSSEIAPPANAPGSSRPSTKSASVTVARSPPVPYAAGPGSAPALSGPTRMRFMSSTPATEPPPAPISTISTTGTRTGSPLPF